MGISSQDIIKMQDKHPFMKYSECNGDGMFAGEIILDHLYKDVRMTGKFEMEIVVPRDYPLALPTVMETSQKIDKKYRHKYINNQLCLAPNLELKMYFNQNSDISDFVDDYIIPYLYTYQYYSKYGIYHYGERNHGYLGDLEYLKELFEIDEWGQLFEILTSVIQSPYRGHLMCPCNSGKRLRMTEEDLRMSNEQLLDNLGLMENGKLKRAAVMLFHRAPEKWVTGAYIKIGYFGEGSDLRYQDEIHGSLFMQADRVVDLIYLKYMKAEISYDNVTRIETYPLFTGKRVDSMF